jgi:hypothetical protein
MAKEKAVGFVPYPEQVRFSNLKRRHLSTILITTLPKK